MDYIPFVLPSGTRSAVETQVTPQVSPGLPWTRHKAERASGSVAAVASCVSERSPEKNVLDQLDDGIHRNVATVAGLHPQIDDFNEKAAMAEFDGGLPRAHAEVLAALQTLDLGRDGPAILDSCAQFLEHLAKNGAIRCKITP